MAKAGLDSYLTTHSNRENKACEINAIIAQLNSSPIDSFKAIKQVWNIDGDAIAKLLMKKLRNGWRPLNRATAESCSILFSSQPFDLSRRRWPPIAPL